MSAAPTFALTTTVTQSDAELVAAVRAGDDAAFEELYRRYYRRIAAFLRRLVKDSARAEDVTQEAFFSALRRLRATDSEIAFKPWIYEIARNASIDLHRRTSRAEEVSMDHYDALRASDRGRLVGPQVPESALLAKERMDHLRGALDELSETHHRIIVMRELEGLSYREIGDRLELSRPAVESTLFRARRRLEREYEELEAGRRCETIVQAIARLAEGVESDADRHRLERHARRCSSCRRRARELGIEPLRHRAGRRAASLLPLPALVRRRGSSAAAGSGASAKAGGTLGSLVLPGAGIGPFLGERAAMLLAALALAGAGGAALSTSNFDSPDPRGERPAAVRQLDGGPAEGAREPATPRLHGGPGGPAAAGRDSTRDEGAAAPGGERRRSAPRRAPLELGEGLVVPRTPAVPELPKVEEPELPSLPQLDGGPGIDRFNLSPTLPPLTAPALPSAAQSLKVPSAPALPAASVSTPAPPVSLP